MIALFGSEFVTNCYLTAFEFCSKKESIVKMLNDDRK